MCSLVYASFHLAYFFWDSSLLCVSVVCSLLLLSIIPLYGHTTICLWIFLLMNTWTVSSYCFLYMKLLFFFFFFMSKYICLQVLLLGHRVGKYLHLSDSDNLFPKWLCNFKLPPAMNESSSCSTSLSMLSRVCFNLTILGLCKVISLWFYFSFPWWLLMLSAFSYAYWFS